MMPSPEGRISLSTGAFPLAGCQVMSHWLGRFSCHTKVKLPSMKSVVNLCILLYFHLGGSKMKSPYFLNYLLCGELYSWWKNTSDNKEFFS